MSAQDFFYAHGEKVAVSLTLVLCALGVYSATSDESMRPRDISAERIAAQNQVIEKVFADGKPPTLKAMPDYLGDMKRRFTQGLSPLVVDSWLTAAPDRGPSSRGLLAYVFEAPAPTVTASDAIGKASLVIALPAATRAADRRLADARTAAWKRPDENITNHAEVVGLLVEVRVGDGEWRPWQGPGTVQGVLPLDALPASGALTVDGLEPWVRHAFRATPVVKATGPEVGVAPIPAQAVLVKAGRITGDDVNWTALSESLQSTHGAVPGFAKPLTGPLAQSLHLQSGERAYLGEPSAEAVVNITSDVQMAFLKMASDAGDPTKEVAHVLVTRLLGSTDGASTWLAEPKIMKVAKGQPIQGEAELKTAKGIQRLRLDTGFRVVEVRRDQERVQYYEVREKPREGSKGKILEVVAKKVTTDVLVVESVRSGNRMEFVKLAKIAKPARADATYPVIPDAGLNEEDLFRKQPGANQKAELVPPAPKIHQPGTGPLEKVRADHPAEEATFYTTDTAYVEFPGQRLVWYEPVNRKVRQWPEAQAAAADATAAPPAGAPLPEAPRPAGVAPVVPPAPPVAPPPGAARAVPTAPAPTPPAKKP